MTIQQIALQMFPYWLLGLFMIWATLRSEHKDLLRISPKAVAKWVLFLCGLTVYRYIVLTHTHGDFSAVSWIPWQMTLTVFWEDAAHVLPILLIMRLMGESKWTRPVQYVLTAFMMFSFGLGHVYQGVFSACLLSLYIPFGIKTAKKHGLGTMMVCHVLYDLSTLLLIQYIMRLMS